MITITNTEEDPHAIRKEHYFSIAKQSWLLIRACIYHLPSRLVILTGMSSTGKTSLAASMSETDPQIVHVEIDKLVNQQLDKMLREYYHENFAEYLALKELVGENLLFYIYFTQGNDPFIKNSKLIENNQAQQFLKHLKETILASNFFNAKLYVSVTYALLDIINREMLNGRTVILDLVASEQDMVPFMNYSPCIVTCIIDVNKLSENLTSRNEQAIQDLNESGYRLPSNTHSQWPSFFVKKHMTDKKLPTILTIDKPQFKTKVGSDLVLQSKAGLFELEQIKSYIKGIMKKLDLTDGSNDYRLREPVHYVLNYRNNYLEQQQSFKKIVKMPRGIKTTHYPLVPSLLIFDGTTMAGKTTVANALMELNSNVQLYGRSERQREILLRTMPSQLKDQPMFNSKAISFARNKDDELFKQYFPQIAMYNDLYLEELNHYCRSQQEKIFREEESAAALDSREHCNIGASVILDNMIFKKDLSAFSGLSPIIILIYCPFDTLLEHIIFRNTKAVLTNRPDYWRNPFLALQTFSIFFSAQNPYNAEAIDTISRQEILGTIEILFSKYDSHLAKINKMDYTNKILKDFGLDTYDTVSIYPQLNRPELVLNTKENPDDNGAKIIQFVYNRPQHHKHMR